jgi:hypothetical protein
LWYSDVSDNKERPKTQIVRALNGTVVAAKSEHRQQQNIKAKAKLFGKTKH